MGGRSCSRQKLSRFGCPLDIGGEVLQPGNAKGTDVKLTCEGWDVSAGLQELGAIITGYQKVRCAGRHLYIFAV